jgi:hypothetical protein
MDKPLTAKSSKPQATSLDNSRFPNLLAAIDMGSNSFRLEIAELHKGATSALTTSRKRSAWAPGWTATAC